VPTFNEDIVTAVLSHMNGDHTDDNLLIARALGSTDATASVMTTLDEFGGTWNYETNGEQHELTVPWSETLTERAQIRREVVMLYRRACGILGVVPRDH
jgi:hypothetical protein